jgi:hypothetical protein
VCKEISASLRDDVHAVGGYERISHGIHKVIGLCELSDENSAGCSKFDRTTSHQTLRASVSATWLATYMEKTNGLAS